MPEVGQPLVSVVTPFYNTVDFLGECIESVLDQSYEHWEYILLDNCSTDGSSDLAAGYAAQDDRIRLIQNQEFLGQLENYNEALNLISADSQYTKVVEADNWIYPGCLEQMVRLAEAHPRLGLVSAYAITERTVRFIGLPTGTRVLDGRDTVRMHLLDDAYLFGAPTSVLVRSNIVRDRESFFDATIWLGSDMYTYYEILSTWDFGFVHQVLTFIRTDNEGSIQSARQGFGAMALDRLTLLTRQGKQFLSDSEYRSAYKKTRTRYYEELAFGVLRRKGRDFWEFHRRGLNELGTPIQPWRVALQVLVEITWMVANPGHSLMSLKRFIQQRLR